MRPIFKESELVELSEAIRLAATKAHRLEKGKRLTRAEEAIDGVLKGTCVKQFILGEVRNKPSHFTSEDLALMAQAALEDSRTAALANDSGRSVRSRDTFDALERTRQEAEFGAIAEFELVAW